MPRLNRTRGVRPSDSRSRRPEHAVSRAESARQAQSAEIHPAESNSHPEQRFQSQKLETIGQLAGGLAHDFNNLLGVILGYCEMLEEQPALPVSVRDMVGEIRNAGSSAKNLTQRLLAFSRRQTLQPAPLDLNRTVKRTEAMLGRLIGENIALQSVLCAEPAIVKADPSQIELMLMNLAINARDAMPQGGRIAIETSNIAIDEACARPYSPAMPGRHVLLSVRDTGIGMDAETQSHIFEPFYTTKPCGQGTGLGLSSVFDVVKQSGGFITVDSAPGQGATFKVYFPECAEAPAELQPRKAKPLQRGSETVLLVDDAAPLRALMRRLLEEAGYRVLEAGDAVQALRVAAAHTGPLPLMITDMVMPGMSGSALADKMAAMRPETAVLYTSGYNGEHAAQICAMEQEHTLLEKPFTREELLRKVRSLLDLRAELQPPLPA